MAEGETTKHCCAEVDNDMQTVFQVGDDGSSHADQTFKAYGQTVDQFRLLTNV